MDPLIANLQDQITRLTVRVAQLEKLVPPVEEQRAHVDAHRELEVNLEKLRIEKMDKP